MSKPQYLPDPLDSGSWPAPWYITGATGPSGPPATVTGSGLLRAIGGVIMGAALLGTAAQIPVVNAGATDVAFVSVAGDGSITSLGALTVSKVNGTSVPAGGALTTGNVLQVTGASALGYGPLNLAGGVNYVTGLLPLANVTPSGTNGWMLYTTGGVAVWAAPPVSGINQLTGDVTAGPGTGSVAATVVRINGSTVPAGGALTTGNGLYVTGVGALSYSSLNLAGGANYVTGVLPAANQASQAMGGVIGGTTAATTYASGAFGALNLSTTGTLASGPITVTPGTVVTTAAGLFIQNPGVGATQGSVLIGSYGTGYGAVWFSSNADTPSATNFTFAGNGTSSSFNGATTAYIKIGGSTNVITVTSTLLTSTVPILVGTNTLDGTSLFFGVAVAAPTIYQTATAVLNATGAPMTVQAQNSTNGTTVGGSLTLQSGTGTTAGSVLIKSGATTAVTVTPTAVQLGAWNLTSTGYIALGASPAASGTIRGINGFAIVAQTLAAADVSLLTITAGNNIQIGSISAGTGVTDIYCGTSGSLRTFAYSASAFSNGGGAVWLENRFAAYAFTYDANAVTSVTISQGTHATTPRTFTIQAANVTTGTGSDLNFTSGTGLTGGVSTPGTTRIQAGGLDHLRVGMGLKSGGTLTSIKTVDVYQSAFRAPYRGALTINYVCDANGPDHTVSIDTTASAHTFTLPLAADHPNRIVAVVEIGGANSVTVTPVGGDTVDGAATDVLPLGAGRQRRQYQSNGVSDWVRIA